MTTLPAITVLPPPVVSPAIVVSPQVVSSPGSIAFTPNSISGGVAGWWETYPGLEGIAQPWTEASSTMTALNAWAETLLTNLVFGAADPDGGANAATIIETVDGAPEQHYAAATLGNHTSAWSDVTVWLKPEAGGRNWYLLYMNTGLAGRYVNAATGATAQYGGDTVTTVTDLGAASGGRWFRVSFRDQCAAFRVYTARDDGASVSYQGDGRTCGYIYLPPAVGSNGLEQTRLSAIADLSRIGGTGAYRGANLVNAVTTTQLLFQDAFVSLNGRPLALGENGRASYMRVTHADTNAVFNGDDPPFCVFGIWGGSAPIGPVFAFVAGVAEYDQPVFVSGGTIRTRRKEASAAADTQDFGVAVAEFATPQAYALICNSDRTRELWIAGTLRGTVTMADLPAVTTIDIVNLHYYTGTTYQQSTAALAIRAGQLPGATAADRYQVIRPALQAMAARWGGLPA